MATFSGHRNREETSHFIEGEVRMHRAATSVTLGQMKVGTRDKYTTDSANE